MKERPIIFNSEMVRAILDGRKTQTRRIVKPQPVFNSSGCWWPENSDHPACMHYANEVHFKKVFPVDFLPYGQTGDRLWVRETITNALNCAVYKADYERVLKKAGDGLPAEVVFSRHTIPCIHMPRWASRITLEITNVRVERINDISEQNAMAEGVGRFPYFDGEHSLNSTEKYGHCTFMNAFANMWKSIYPGSWERNDWVWVIEFKRINNAKTKRT